MQETNKKWLPWFMAALSLLMTVEYTRLVWTTNVATYRYFVLALWVTMALYWLTRIVQNQNSQSKNDSQSTGSDK